MSITSPRRRRIVLGTVGAIAVPPWSVGLARAATYPGSQPVRLIVPGPPGGSSDVGARLLVGGMTQQLKGTIFVENLAGAAGTIGTARTARAEPDGYTIGLGFATSHTIAPSTIKNLPYDPVRDFTPIGRSFTLKLCVIANPSFPAANLRELIALARKPDSNVMYGGWGYGSTSHLTMESINNYAGLKMGMVPYKGEAPIVQAVLGGEIGLAIATVGVALPHIKAGKLKVLGICSRKRSVMLPEMPTFAEQGVPFDLVAWQALFAPARTPAAIVQQLATALQETLKSRELLDRAEAVGMEYDPISREDFSRQLKEEIATWAKLARAAGVKPE